jgi:hypothetical protein
MVCPVGCWGRFKASSRSSAAAGCPWVRSSSPSDHEANAATTASWRGIAMASASSASRRQALARPWWAANPASITRK